MYTDECTCLESIINRFCNNGKKQQVFLKCVRKNEDGEVTECFTKKGGILYDKFVDLVYGLGKNFKTLGEVDEFIRSLRNIGISSMMSMDEIITETDSIASGSDY